MEQTNKPNRNKGGRPKKQVKKDQLLAVKCNAYERRVIIGKAKVANLSVSEYLRAMALNGKIDRHQKTLPPEVLQLTGTLNHIAAYLNQIAKKRNSFEELPALERAGLQVQSGELKGIALHIKSWLQ